MPVTWQQFCKYLWDKISDHGGNGGVGENVHISLGQGPADYFPGKFVTAVPLIPGLWVGAVG